VTITFLLWNGDIGGAERASVALAGQLRARGTEANVLFVCGPDRLLPQLAAEGVPHAALGLSRGSRVLVHPRRLARAAQELGADAVVAATVGYLGAALRLGGFHEPIVGVEHGDLLRIGAQRLIRRGIARSDRALGALTHDAEVAVSDFMAEAVMQGPHARLVVTIPHGVATDTRPQSLPDNSVLRLGYLGRLFPGKGLDRLLRAMALLAQRDEPPVSLRVAGDGPMRSQWEELAHQLGLADAVSFVGWTDDILGHWAQCHVAVAPNDSFVESFCMSMLEAMAAGRPTLVTNNGALPELVLDGITGRVVAAGDEHMLAAAISEYRANPAQIHWHGVEARSRAESTYSLETAALGYVDLAHRLDVMTGRSLRRRRRANRPSPGL
jgi:glycosyltransferase involved in cell wall biosynthesis